MKSHIGPDGPGKCTAQEGNCPFGEGENHFNTITEARKVYQERLEKAYSKAGEVKRKEKSLSKREKELLSNNAKMAQQIVELRSKNNGLTFEDANPERAERRLKEAINYAQERQNNNLIKKLTGASVLPSGAFKLEDGARVNTDKLLEEKTSLNYIENGRKKLLESVTSAIGSDDVNEKFTLKTDAGSFSLTIGESFNQDEFDNLPDKLRNSISSPKESLSIDLARNNINSELLKEITSKSQVLDFVLLKPKDIGQDKVPYDRKIVGSTSNEKAQSGLQNIADFYQDAHNTFGKVRDIKKSITETGSSMKKACTDRPGASFIPARSQLNGALVTNRLNINRKLAEEKLTSEQLKSITNITSGPDIEKAKAVLPVETFNKIFKSRTASLRVTESK